MFEATLFLAGVILGLWWGERGRRIDAQKAIGIYRPPLTPKAKVKDDADLEGTAVESMFTEEQVEKMIQDTMAETGCNRELAELDVVEMMRASSTMGMGH